MHAQSTTDAPITLQPVSRESWQAVANITVAPEQAEFVASGSYYLAMCCYGDIWQPLAISRGDEVIGFCMWGVDPADGSCWLGGIMIDQQHQRRGYGRRAIEAAIAMLAEQHGHRHFALSYSPDNHVARQLYHSLGFRETGEMEEEEQELVARLELGADGRLVPQ